MRKRTEFQKAVIAERIAEMQAIEVVNVPEEYKTGKAKRFYEHACYLKAYQYMFETKPVGAVLVHGIANNYGHAWVELPGDIIFDGVLQRFYDKGGYYRVKQAIKEREYTREEMIKAALAARHMGPWDNTTVAN